MSNTYHTKKKKKKEKKERWYSKSLTNGLLSDIHMVKSFQCQRNNNNNNNNKTFTIRSAAAF